MLKYGQIPNLNYVLKYRILIKAGEKMFDIKKVDDAINRIVDGIAAEEKAFKSFGGIEATAEITTDLAELIRARAEFDKRKTNI